MGFANEILDAIEIMVRQVVEDNTTKIYTGVCKTTGVNNCVLTINGKDNTVKYYGGVPVIGTVYQVFIPFGNMSAAFIIVPGSGGGSGGSGVNSVNGKTGDVVLNAADVSALPNTTVIPSKTSQLTNDSGYITVSDAPVKSVDGETGDVVTNAIKSTQQNLSDTQKSQARANIGAGTSSFDGNYSSLSGKPTIPSSTSQLNNDSGFITSENAPVKSVNGKTGDVTLNAADVGLGNVDNIKQYSENNPPPYPVTSVNRQTGGVNLTASDVGADASGAAAAVQSNLDGHTGNTTVHIKAAERTKWNDKSGKAVSFTVILTAAGWSGNTQNVSNSKFVTSGYAYTVCPAGDSFAGYAEAVIYADDVTTAGKMTFHCNEAPTVNLTVNILRTEVTA